MNRRKENKKYFSNIEDDTFNYLCNKIKGIDEFYNNVKVSLSVNKKRFKKLIVLAYIEGFKK